MSYGPKTKAGWHGHAAMGIIGVGGFGRAIAAEAMMAAQIAKPVDPVYMAPDAAYTTFTPAAIPFTLGPYLEKLKQEEELLYWNAQTGQRKHRKPTPTNLLPGKKKRKKPGKKTHRR